MKNDAYNINALFEETNKSTLRLRQFEKFSLKISFSLIQKYNF